MDITDDTNTQSKKLLTIHVDEGNKSERDEIPKDQTYSYFYHSGKVENMNSQASLKVSQKTPKQEQVQ